jgi:hypothetical protein
MELFAIMTKWFWAVCIAVTFLNAGIFRFRAQRHIREHPELADGYRSLIRGFISWGNIPWIVMGLGCTIGGVRGVWHYLRPRDGNPWVIAWFASVFALWLLGTYWLLFRGGAEMLVRHPGLFNVELKRPSTIKLLWFICLAGGIFGVIMMFTQDMPMPPQ